MWNVPGHNQHIPHAHLWYVCRSVEGDCLHVGCAWTQPAHPTRTPLVCM